MMPSASFLFLLSFYFRNLPQEIFSECAEKVRGFFIRQDGVLVQREALGDTHRAWMTPSRGLPYGGRWDLPLLLVGPLGPIRRL